MTCSGVISEYMAQAFIIEGVLNNRTVYYLTFMHCTNSKFLIG